MKACLSQAAMRSQYCSVSLSTSGQSTLVSCWSSHEKKYALFCLDVTRANNDSVRPNVCGALENNKYARMLCYKILLIVFQQLVAEVILVQFVLRSCFYLVQNRYQHIFELFLWYWIIVQPVPAVEKWFLQ